VLLACFEVERCRVVRICNSERQFVLAPANLRYWGFTPRFSGCCAQPESSQPQPPRPAEEPRPAPLAPPDAPPAGLRRLDAIRRGAPLLERLGVQLLVQDRSAALQAELAELRRRLDGQERRLKERK
jgi:hypothetical protein